MRKISPFVFSLLLLAIFCASNAYSLPQVNSLLASYNVPNSVYSTLKPVNLTYAGKTYVGMYNTNNAPVFIVNTTGAYSIVLNASAIANIISNYTVNLAISRSNFTSLANKAKAYQSSGAGLLNDCYARTGYTSGLTCNVTNNCAACKTVPICSRLFNNASINTGGAGLYGSTLGTFGVAVLNYGNQYLWLNQSFTKFYASASHVNSVNSTQKVAVLNAAFLNISNLTQTMGNSTLFEYTGSLNLASICPPYQGSASAPWYCTAIGLCQNLNYNYTKLSMIQTLLAKINMQPLSSSQIYATALNVSNNETTYVLPVLSKQKLAQLGLLINATVPGYATLVNNTRILLIRFPNATLQTDLSSMQSAYKNATTNYLTENFSKTNVTLAAQYAALNAEYTKLNSTYGAVITKSENNTAKIIELELSGMTSPKLSDLALTEMMLNVAAATGSSTGNVTTLNTQLSVVASQLSQYSIYPITLTEIARAIDAPFIRSFAITTGLSHASGVSLAPLLGSLLSLIIGIVVIVAIMFYRSYLNAHHRLRVTPQTEKHWRFAITVIAGLVILYFILTFVLLSGASSSAPFGAFKSTYSSSKFVVIATNSTPDASELACANQMSARASLAGKKPIIASFSGGVCRAGNTTGTVDSCLGVFANSNIPVVILNNSAHSSLTLYSLYGTVLSANGNDTVMNSCYASLLLSK